MALTTHDQDGAPRHAQDEATKHVVLAGRLERGAVQDSLSLHMSFAGETGSVLVYEIGVEIAEEVPVLAHELLERSLG